jgi:hypothetical protein
VSKAELPTTPEPTRLLFEARLAELTYVRDELVGAIANQHLVLTFGTSSVVGVLVAGFLTRKDPTSWAVFLAVPPIAGWVLAMWLAEVVRMLRAAEFCREQAEIVNQSLRMDGVEHPPIRWEQWREEPGRTIKWSYPSVVAILSGGYLVAALFGLITADWSLGVDLAVAFVLLLGFLALLRAVWAVYRRWGAAALGD